jgi:hypothetical protein
MRIIEHVEVMEVDSSLTVGDPESGRRLTVGVEIVGDDLVLAVGGGERPHVGCVVLAQPRASKRRPDSWSASCSVLTIPPHKEEPIARGIATRLSEEFGRVTVVTAGVHDGDLDREGVATYLRLGEELAEALVMHLAELFHKG